MRKTSQLILSGFAALAGIVVISAASHASPGDAAAKDAATPVKTEVPAMVGAEVGKKAPEFKLKDTDGKEHNLAEYTKAGNIVVIEWFNPDCPFIKKHHVKNKSMASLHTEQKEKKVVWLAINSSAPGKQGAGLDRNKLAKTEYAIEYPILLDETGAVGRMYGAKTTPHMFVIAPDGMLVYKGAFDDDKSPEKVGPTLYVRTAVNQFTSGGKVDPSETVSYGCSVKYADKTF